MEWFEVRLEADERVKDAVANRLFEIGAQGVTEGDGEGRGPLQAYFPLKDRERVLGELERFRHGLKEVLPECPPLSWQLLEVRPEDWAESYKEFYRAQPLSRRFYLRPAWDATTRIPDGFAEIVLEPGQAFGTGLHGSTRVCLRFLEDTLGDGSGGGLRLMDVGTGTGILAIAARKLGVKDITAIDIDPIAVDAARENFERNGCDGVIVDTRPLSDFPGPYDYIVSNILLETHRELASQYRERLKPGGSLVLAGLLTEQEEEVEALFASLGFRRRGTEVLGEWLGLHYTR